MLTPGSRVIEKKIGKSVAAAENIKLTILRLTLAVALLLLARVLLPVGDEPGQVALVTMIYASAAMFASLLLRPQSDMSILAALGWCLTVAGLFAVLLAVDPITRPLLMFLPRIAVTLLLLTATLAILARRVPVPIAVTVLALITLLPIWAAPAVELAGNPVGLTSAVVHSSPLTAFAMALDLDYLRSNWFYANSALGSMRYSYPGWPTYCLLYSLLPATALFLEFVRPAATSSIRLTKEAHS